MKIAFFPCCMIYLFVAIALTSGATQRAIQAQETKNSAVHQGIQEVELREAVATEIKNDPRLGGAWLSFRIVSTSGGEHDELLEVFLTVDTARSKEQSALLADLLRRQAPKVPFRIRSITRLPISQLIHDLQSQIESDAALQGCAVVGAYVAPQPLAAEGQLLVLEGRVADSEQRDLIQDKCLRLMQRQAVWRNQIDRYLPNGQSLSVVKPAVDKAQYFYDLGLHHFWAGNPRDALTEFKQGILENPESLDLRYWQAISYLSLNRREEAAKCVQDAIRILRVDTYSEEYHNLQHALRRVQGPLRRELRELEAYALSELLRRSPHRNSVGWYRAR